MDELIEGYRKFRSEVWPTERARYEALAHWGQSPETMILACSGHLRFAAATSDAIKKLLEWFGERPGIHEGDQIFFNDPYVAGSHTYDQMVVTIASIAGGATPEFSGPPISNPADFASGRTRLLSFNSTSLTSPSTCPSRGWPACPSSTPPRPG